MASRPTMNLFKYEDHQLRTIEIDGEPWFHATDACKCVGLSTAGGTHQHLLKVDKDEKRTLSKTNNPVVGVAEFMGRAGTANAVSESGLYRLIMRADGAKAKPFRDWVVKVVLPSIRKTGGYLLNENARETAHADTKDAMPLPAVSKYPSLLDIPNDFPVIPSDACRASDDQSRLS